MPWPSPACGPAKFPAWCPSTLPTTADATWCRIALSAWLLGFVSHLVNSVVLVLVWATVIEPNLGWPRPLEGLAWGLFLALTLAGSIIMPLSGVGFMGRKAGSYRLAVTALLLHGLWGLLIGLIYVPP